MLLDMKQFPALLSVTSGLFLSQSLAPAPPSGSSAPQPTVTVKNGTFVGRYLERPWDQDAFLGVPYAQAPVGSLRFARPLPLDEAFGRVQNASAYGYSCYQLPDEAVGAMSEDCLTLNVVRPRGTSETSKLPVLVWIHGGGYRSGSSSMQVYNVSGLVRLSQDIEEPLIVVSMNYRLDLWGLLQTPELFLEHNTNAGLYDQRLALQWLQENVGAFGGDPERVTIWGESAGGSAVGLHLHAFGGRDKGLFHSAILESGTALTMPMYPLSHYAVAYANVTRSVTCGAAASHLACLRAVPAEDLAAAMSNAGDVLWDPIVDGDFLQDFPSRQMSTSDAHIPVPLLIGANSDDGIVMAAAQGRIDTTEELAIALLTLRHSALSLSSVTRLLELYPVPGSPPAVNKTIRFPPTHLPDNASIPAHLGKEYRHLAAIAGDVVFHAGRRWTCTEYTHPNQSAPQPVWSYRFDQPLWDASPYVGSDHFVNTLYSFQNTSGLLGPLPQNQHHLDLARAIGQAYIGFAARGDPNAFRAKGGAAGVLPEWPAYGDAPTNMVFDAAGSWVEDDTWREDVLPLHANETESFVGYRIATITSHVSLTSANVHSMVATI